MIKDDKKLLIELICSEQTGIIVKDTQGMSLTDISTLRN